MFNNANIKHLASKLSDNKAVLQEALGEKGYNRLTNSLDNVHNKETADQFRLLFERELVKVAGNLKVRKIFDNQSNKYGDLSDKINPNTKHPILKKLKAEYDRVEEAACDSLWRFDTMHSPESLEKASTFFKGDLPTVLEIVSNFS